MLTNSISRTHFGSACLQRAGLLGPAPFFSLHVKSERRWNTDPAILLSLSTWTFIMPTSQGLRASLVSNDVPITEYPTKDALTTTVYCESVPDQIFAVKLNGCHPEGFDFKVVLRLDGVIVDSWGCYRHRPVSLDIRGIYSANDRSKIMPFKFANINLCG